MPNDVPQWLVQAYVRSVQSAGSPLSKEELAQACDRLIARWSSSDRSYHGLQHVVQMLTRLETLLPETHEPSLVRLAAWYHGVVFSTAEEDAYTRNGGENENTSATLAQTHLLGLGVDPEKARRIGELIRGMRRADRLPNETAQFQAVDVDELALRDAHLGSLAVDPQRYKRYLEQVGEEYAHIPHRDFLLARREIVSHLLARRQLFATPLARQWDRGARENLEAELERISRILSAQTDDQPAGASGAHLSTPAPSDSLPAARTSAAVPESTGHSNSAPAPSSAASSKTSSAASSPAAHVSSPRSASQVTPSSAVPNDSSTTTRGSTTRGSTTRGTDVSAAETGTRDSETHAKSNVARNAGIDALLRASAEADEKERIEAEREEALLRSLRAFELASPAPIDTLSTMEACQELVDPGVREREALTPEEKKQRRREAVAAEIRRRIEERLQTAAAIKRAREEQELGAMSKPGAMHGEADLPDDADLRDDARLEGDAHGSPDPSFSAHTSPRTDGTATPDSPVANSASRAGAPATSGSTASSTASFSPPATAPTPEWIDDDDERVATKRDQRLTPPRLTSDREPDVHSKRLQQTPTHGIEREPDD